MPQPQEILEMALELPEKEREMLVDKLAASLHGGFPSFASEEIEQAWGAEITRRCSDLDSGRAVLHDWDEVRDKILADLRARP